MRDWHTVADGFIFPEGPRWHDGALWLSDIHGHRVWRVQPDGTKTVMAELSNRPSGLGFLPDGTPLIVSMFDKRLLRIGPRGLDEHADLSSYCDGFLNDMVVDAQGTAYVGARNRSGDAPRDAVIGVRTDGTSWIAAERMSSPNGSVVTPDGRTLIVAETSIAALTAFDIDSDGALRNRRPFAEIPGAHPDGIALDAEGAVWFGSPMAEEFVRVKEGGDVTHRWKTPGQWAIACAIGAGQLWGVVGINSVENITAMGDDPRNDVRSTATGAVVRRVIQ